MYPNLTFPLLAMVAIFAAGLVGIALFRPVARRLASRQLARRPGEALLAIIGATLGTAIIVGALVVGDTLDHSVTQVAYRTLGPVDERVVAADARTGQIVAHSVAQLRGDPRVDGVVSAQVVQAAAASGDAGTPVAEPRVLAWDYDYGSAAGFGGANGASGLHVAPPPAGTVYINQPLAQSLHLHAGSQFTLYLYERPHVFRVRAVLPDQGLAGTGFGATRNRNVFLATGTLAAYAHEASVAVPQTVTFVSNRGGVEEGADLTDEVAARIRQVVGGLPASVDTPKRAVLDQARKTGDALGALFLMIGSFSIIAGALLLVNIFTMLADERRSQLGMLRAVGMKRTQLVESLGFEGAGYALASVLPGIGLGIGVGWAVAQISAQIFRAWSADGNGLDIAFAVRGTSIVNAAALGLVIAFATIFGASARISRFNVIAAIRDLPQVTASRKRRHLLVGSTLLAVLFAVLSVPAIATSKAETTLLLPALSALLVVPVLTRLTTSRTAISSVAATVLGWAVVAPLVRPRMFDNPSMAIYVIQGSIIAFAGVALLSQNQSVVVRPFRAVVERPTSFGMALRLGVAYPIAKRFRTGATLVMYTLITLVLVLLIEITGVINRSIDMNVADATAGYSLRLDVNPADASRTFADLRSGPFAGEVRQVAPLTTAPSNATDPGRRTTSPVRAVAVGVPDGALDAMRLSDRLAGFPTDAQVWRLVARDPRYVLLDQFFNATGGPNGKFYAPGDTMTLTDPQTGRAEEVTIAGILSSAMVFYPVTGNSTNTYPVVMSAHAVSSLFPRSAAVTSALLRTSPGVDPQHLGERLQGRYLAASLVASPIAANVRSMFAANIAFFRLMQGFLALGLLIGITGLGVVMVRAVRERRRTIGVLRALGFQAATVQRSFLVEGTFVASEGVLLGAALGVLSTWLMYQKSAAFDGVRAGFPIEWPIIVTLALATLLASLSATVGPARRAARILPALAVRVAD